MPNQLGDLINFCDSVTLGRLLKCARSGILFYKQVRSVPGALGYLFYRSLLSLSKL